MRNSTTEIPACCKTSSRGPSARRQPTVTSWRFAWSRRAACAIWVSVPPTFSVSTRCSTRKAAPTCSFRVETSPWPSKLWENDSLRVATAMFDRANMVWVTAGLALVRHFDWRVGTMGENCCLNLLLIRQRIVPAGSRSSLNSSFQKITVPKLKDQQVPKLPGAVPNSLPMCWRVSRYSANTCVAPSAIAQLGRATV